jgi:hypothetical protein
MLDVATGVAHPPRGEWHGRPILHDYTRVEVHTVKPDYMNWEIDHETPEGLVRLGEVMKQFILWHKKDIVLNVCSPTPSDVHLEQAIEDRDAYSPARDNHTSNMPLSFPAPSEHMTDPPQTSLAHHTEQGHNEMPQRSPAHLIEQGHE